MIPGNANPLLLASAAEAAAAGPTRSLRFNSGDSAYLSRTPSSSGNRRTFTFSCWVKRSKPVPSGSGQELFRAGDSALSAMNFAPSDGPVDSLSFKADQGGVSPGSATNAVFRDFSAWMHVVYRIDTTQATAADRVRVYVNGVEQTWHTTNYPSQNQELKINQSGQPHYIGGKEYFDGYLADIHLIDGSSLEPTSFGAYDDNGVWQAAAYSGTFGTNGFHLNFADGSDLGADNSGNDNDFTPNNLLGTVDPADVSVASATGALPIYNTTDTYGATQGTGTRTDSDASSLVLAIPFLTNQNDVHATVKGSGSNKTVSGSGASASSTKDKFYGGSFRFDGSTATPMNVADSDDFTFDGDFTVEAWVWPDATDAFQIVASKWDVGGQEFILAVESGGKAEFHWAPYSDGGPAIESAAGVVNAKAWNHLAAVRSSGTITLYVNGTSVGTRSNSTAATNRSTLLTIGYLQYLGGNKLAGYLQDLRIYKGAAKYTSNFNPPSDPADKLPGEGLDLLFDVPTNGTQSDTGAGGEVSGNYCTINPLSIPSQSVTLSNGNLDHTGAGTNVARVGTIAIPSSGKWYWEITCNSGGSGAWLLGINGDTNSQALRLAYVSDARKYTDAGGGFSSYGASFGVGDVIGVAVDMDADTLTFYKNGSSQGTAFTSISSGYTNIFPYFQTEQSGRGLSVNFGQRAWAYSAPSNHKALCTTNLPTPTIADGSDYFDIALYTGDGTSPRSITLPIAGDLLWMKARNDSASHQLVDTVRGNNAVLISNSTNEERNLTTQSVGGGISSLSNTTAVITEGTGTNDNLNENNKTYVAWTWDAGSSTVSNTDGSITSSVRANTTAGFSIVSYTGNGTAGATVGHGISEPSVIIVKDRTQTQVWNIYHASKDTAGDLHFDTSTGTVSDKITATSSTTFTVADDGNVNRNNDNYIAYCFAPVAGYSAFGSYTGNGSSDGPFVFTNFRVAFMLTKRTDSTSDWLLYDSTRDPFNAADARLRPNGNGSEATADPRDFLSNGFKIRDSGGNINSSGGTYIYIAFAENPFQANGGLAR